MADSFDVFQVLLRENLSERVVDLQLETDDPWWRIMDTMEPETVGGRDTASSPTPGYEARWLVRLQRAGRVAGGTFNGPTPVMMGKGTDRAMGQASDALYLDPADTPMRSHVQIKTYLKRLLFSLAVNRQQIVADLIGQPVAEIAAGMQEDIVYLYRHLVCSLGWADGSGMIARVNDASPSAITETAGGVAVTVDWGTAFRFVEGQRYVSAGHIAAASYGASPRVGNAGTLNTPGVMRCVQVDAHNRTIYLQSEPGEGNITLADNDALMPEGLTTWTGSTVDAQSRAPDGWESLVVGSGNFPETTLDVAHYNGLKGWVDGSAAVTRMPTPEEIAKILDQMADAGINPPPVLVSERSIRTLYSQLERQGGASYLVPQGAPFQASGGITAPNVGHYDHTFAWLDSSMIQPNTVGGLTPGSWTRYMPLGNKTIHWLNTTSVLAGAPAMFRLVTSGRTATELFAADGEGYCQFALKEPRKQVRMLGVQNQRDM